MHHAMRRRRNAASGALFLLLSGVGVHTQSVRHADAPPGSAQAIVQQALDGDGRVCDAMFLSSPPGRPATVLASVDASGRFCNEVILVRADEPPSVRQQIPAWGVDALSVVVRELDRSGSVKLALPQPFSDYEGAAACMATTPVVYTCSDAACTDVSDQSRELYALELDERRRRLGAAENRGPDEDARDIPCLMMEIDKLQRVLGMNPQAGFTAAEAWMTSADPVARRRAAAVFTDIGDAPSRQRLERLANDTDPRVASAARLSLARQR